jgi:hypothetical protein
METLASDSPEMSDTKSVIASKGWLHRFGKNLVLKNRKITREASSANKESAATFPAGLKKLSKEKGRHPKQVPNGDETRLLCKKIPN